MNLKFCSESDNNNNENEYEDLVFNPEFLYEDNLNANDCHCRLDRNMSQTSFVHDEYVVALKLLFILTKSY